MFRNSLDALTRLLTSGPRALELPEYSYVSAVKTKIGILRNGIRHCIVQVTFATGAEYQFEAFGGEAEELDQMARHHPSFRDGL